MSEKLEHVFRMPKSAEINFIKGCMHCGRTDTELHNYTCNAGCPDEGAPESEQICKPTPGIWINNGGKIEAIVRDNFPHIDIAIVGEVNNQCRSDTATANHICRCVNSHDALYEACKRAKEVLDVGPRTMQQDTEIVRLLDMIEAALDRVEKD